MVRVNGDSYRELKGKIGMLERFTAVILIVDRKRYIARLRDLEPVDSPDESQTGTDKAESAPKGVEDSEAVPSKT